MSYKVSDGIPEKDLPKWIKKALTKYGTYKEGGVDYTDAPVAPIVMCTLLYKNKLLLLKRGYGLADAEGSWSVIDGFIDEDKPVKEIAKKEFKEELGIVITNNQIKVGGSFTLKSDQEKRAYVVFPVLVQMNEEPKIRLDREHTDFAWIKRSELDDYQILDDLPFVIDKTLELL